MFKHVLVGLMTACIFAAPLSASAQSEPKASAASTKQKPSAARTSARERQKQCGAEWREAKAAGKIEKGMKWPKYWSECNKRLKAKSG
ncbi:MAG: hypothetical protein WA418_20390 [Bradyrhizobium sp.]